LCPSKFFTEHERTTSLPSGTVAFFRNPAKPGSVGLGTELLPKNKV